MDSDFTVEDVQAIVDDFKVSDILLKVEKSFIEADGYWELYNIGRDKPLTKLEFLKLCDR